MKSYCLGRLSIREIVGARVRNGCVSSSHENTIRWFKVSSEKGMTEHIPDMTIELNMDPRDQASPENGEIRGQVTGLRLYQEKKGDVKNELDPYRWQGLDIFCCRVRTS